MTGSSRSHGAGAIRPRAVAAPVVRRSRSATAARLLGALGMIGLTVLLYWLLTDPSFRITPQHVTFEGLVHADEAAVRSHLSGLDRGPNVFRVRAADIVGDVATLTDVDAASATVTLPAEISVRLEERQPLFVWRGGDTTWLVDADGMLFGPTVAVTDGATADGTTADGTTAGAGQSAVVAEGARDDLPVVEDARITAQPLHVGSYLAPIDFAVMRQLLALTPERLGSRSTELQLRVDQKLGYQLLSDRGWLAIFGHYWPLVQPPEEIPRQVQCLAALLDEGEARLNLIRLSVSDDACGTYTERGS